LILVRFFALDGGVPPQNELTSLTAIDPAAAGHYGAAFTTTHWSVVLEAQGETPEWRRRIKPHHIESVESAETLGVAFNSARFYSC
jgi:hypothetical protein